MEDKKARNSEFSYTGAKSEQGVHVTSVTYIKKYIRELPSGRRLQIMVNNESEFARLIHH
ncbi:MAG: hypothetical protein SVO26_08485 [Chloroflexota bacterium]|nr:hypothetical protein [Chloroflexota bacterium]